MYFTPWDCWSYERLDIARSPYRQEAPADGVRLLGGEYPDGRTPPAVCPGP